MESRNRTEVPGVPNSSGVTARLCSWIDGLQLKDVPEGVQTRAKHLILDGLACAIAGAHVPWSRKAAQSIGSFEPAGCATVFGHQYVRAQCFMCEVLSNTLTGLLFHANP